MMNGSDEAALTGLDAISRSWHKISYSRSSLRGDRGFESCSLQRGVSCEPAIEAIGASSVGCDRPSEDGGDFVDVGASRFRLPPAVLADHDARVEIVVEPGAGAHHAFRRLDRHPLAVREAARPCCNRMEFHFGA